MKKNSKNVKESYLQTAMIVMLVVAVLPLHMYGYYVLLRVVICFGCGYLAMRAYSLQKIGWAWFLGTIAIIYNPFVKIALGKSLWALVNVVTIVALIMRIRENRKLEQDDIEK